MTQQHCSALLVFAGFLTGCGRHDLSQPPNVRFGDEACAYCRMIISDQRFAAAIVDQAGEALKFDDLGCLVEHEAEQFRPSVAYWVRGYDGQRWLNAREATFVHSRGIVSPMNHGLAAFDDARPAEKAAHETASRVLQFDELSGFIRQQLRENTSTSSRSQ